MSSPPNDQQPATNNQRLTFYLRKDDVLSRTVAGATLLVPVHGCTQSVFTLNDTGRRLWELIETPRSEDSLAGALVGQYHIPPEAARQDVKKFLSDMLRLNLVIEQAEES